MGRKLGTGGKFVNGSHRGIRFGIQILLFVNIHSRIIANKLLSSPPRSFRRPHNSPENLADIKPQFLEVKFELPNGPSREIFALYQMPRNGMTCDRLEIFGYHGFKLVVLFWCPLGGAQFSKLHKIAQKPVVGSTCRA